MDWRKVGSFEANHTARFAGVYFAQMHTFRDETALLLLMAVGAFVYGILILLLFGRGWLFVLVRDRQSRS